MQALRQDILYAIRQLRRTPAFTALVVITIALGIGANTAVFSMINGFLRPLPVRAPHQIVVLAAQTKGDETGFRYRLSYPALQDLRAQADSFSDVFAFDLGLSGLNVDGKTQQFLYSVVSGNYFSALGLQPAAGRLFVPGEGEYPGAESLIVLGYGLWQKRFGGLPDAIGRQVRVDGRAARIIGVAPKEFHGTYAGADVEGYMPLNQMALMPFWDTPTTIYTNRATHPMTVMARLKRGVTLEQAQGSVNVLARRLGEQYPATDQGIGLRVIPEYLARPVPLRFLADVLPFVRSFVFILGGLVLALACLNVANLLLVRATVRRRELAIRAALGSSRGRMVRQMLTESALLALMGAMAGVIVGKWGKDAFASSIDLATDFPTVLDFSFDWRVFTYALVAAAVTGLLIGLWPALRASRASAGSVLNSMRSDSTAAGRNRVRSFLVMAQVAGSLVLLIVAGLFMRSLDRAQRMDLGFNPAPVLNVRIDTRQAGYDRARTIEYYRELERRARNLPGAQSVSLAFSSPLGYINAGDWVYVEGRTIEPGEQPPLVGCNSVSSGYFDTLQIPVLQGRAFRDSDTETAPLVAIVNQTMAARFWPRQDVMGKRFHTTKPDGPLFEIVGVARDSKYLAVAEGSLPYFYVPAAQKFYSMRVLQVRSNVPPQRMAAAVQQQILALDADMPISDLQSMKQSMGGPAGFLLFRLGALQASSMGALGLLLAVIGVYGVVSYGAAQRTHEIGVRMALGAQPRDIRSLVLRQGVALVAGGVAAGLTAAAAMTRLTSRFVLLVSSTDPLTFVGVTALLGAIALWACYIPARRAMKVDPLVALRHD